MRRFTIAIRDTIQRQSINYPDSGYDVRTFASLTVGRAQHFPIVLNGMCIGGSCNTRRMHPEITIAFIYGGIDSQTWFSNLAANRPPDRVRRRATRGEHNSKYKITKIYSWRRNDRTCHAGFHRVQHLQYKQCMDIGCSRKRQKKRVYIHGMARRSGDPRLC